MASAPGKDLAPIVVKRVKKVVGGGHGGAWKIAYADFVTAMMAFFLLMWVLGSTTSGDLAGISASGGSACSSGAAAGSHVINALYPGTERTAVRFSFSKLNTVEEVDMAAGKLAAILSGVPA